MRKNSIFSLGKSNHSLSWSVIIAAFVASLLLSLLCSLFYNLWFYEVKNLESTEGDWQARITAKLSSEDLKLMENYASIEKVVINQELSAGNELAADVYFSNPAAALKDMPKIASLLGLPEDSITYHYSLLNMYFVRSPDDLAIRWVFPFFFLVVFVASVSLILVIHNAFAATMFNRIRQFGILSSIGATPRQIRISLLREAILVCSIPVLAGTGLGILISAWVIEGINFFLADIPGRMPAYFVYNPMILLLSLTSACFTVIYSAWIPARKAGKVSPIEAIRNTGDLQLKRKKKIWFLSRLFGLEGELAGNALKAQKKTMRTAAWSLSLSFLSFSFMMCFLTLQMVNQNMTYFEKYQDAWDVMVSVENIDIASFEQAGEIQGLKDVQSAIAYQKAQAKSVISEDKISQEFKDIGGFADASGSDITKTDSGWEINAPIIVMDDASFLAYCEMVGVTPVLDGAIILNQVSDPSDPNFHNRRKVQYLDPIAETTVLENAGQTGEPAEIPVLSYTTQPPVLREEYGTQDFYELVHFIPASLWKEIEDEIGGAQKDTYVRILAEGEATLDELNGIEKSVEDLLSDNYQVETENRIQKKIDNDNMFNGLMFLISLFSGLLALIGMGSTFTTTLGFVVQRKREFARYMSVGMTPSELNKVFWIEALVIICRPVLITVPVTIAAIALFINIAYIEPMAFIANAPLIPVLAFFLAIAGFVALAYYIGSRRVLNSSLADSLRDDTLL